MKAIQTKYIPATNTKPSRVKAWAEGRNSITIPFDSGESGDMAYRRAAQALCDKMNWPGNLIEGGTENGSVFVFAEPAQHNDVTIRFASVEDADNFKKWAKNQIGYESEPGYPGQIRGPGMSIALSAVQRAKLL